LARVIGKQAVTRREMMPHDAFQRGVSTGMAIRRGQRHIAQAGRAKAVEVARVTCDGGAAMVRIENAVALSRSNLGHADGMKGVIGEVRAGMARGAARLAIKEIKPGVEVAFVSNKVREYLKNMNVEKNFTHSLGHSVGIEVHDGLIISTKSKTVFEEGMIFTIEPGLYFEGKFGIRLEDMIIVTKDGCEIL